MTVRKTKQQKTKEAVVSLVVEVGLLGGMLVIDKFDKKDCSEQHEKVIKALVKLERVIG